MSVPDRMRAWQVHVHGTPAEALRLDEVDVPRPDAGQVLLRVAATALNFPDVLLAAGQYQVRPPLPFTPGVEACGEVVAAGDDADAALVGTRVLGMLALPHGGLAGYALADAGSVHAAPAVLDDAQAASLHIGYQTAWFALHRRARLQPGETVLVHAAAGGVGSATVQLARAAGARVVGVVGGDEKVRVARDLGCDEVVDRTAHDDLVPVLREVLGRRGADVVVDPVGGDAYDASTKVVAFEGRLVVVGFTSGRIAQAATNHVLVKNYTVLGLHWGEYHRHDPQAVRDCHADLVRLADEGVVRPLVSERVPMTDVPDALTRLGTGRTTGRVVVEVGA